MFGINQAFDLPHSLPFATARTWITEAKDLWRGNILFFTLAALLILAFRWMLDFGQTGSAIFLSYFTDALLFSAAFLGLSASLSGDIRRPSLIHGWKSLAGRRKTVLATGLLGMPSALAGTVIVFAAPSVATTVAAIFGLTLVGSAILALLGLAAGYVALLLLVAALLSSIHAARTGCGVRAAALWGYTATAAGWKPLTSLFAVFLSATIVAAFLLPSLFNALFAGGYANDLETMETLRYWMNWPGLFVALTVLLALLVPMVNSLDAQTRESGQHTDPTEMALTPDERWLRLVSRNMNRAGILFRVLAAAVLCSVPIYGALQGAAGYGMPLLGAALLWRWGAAFDRSAAACLVPEAGKWRRLEAFWYPAKAAVFAVVVLSIIYVVLD